ncbi:MAG: caspase domain-containing protein [Hyphomicrobiaceae bacterium]
MASGPWGRAGIFPVLFLLLAACSHAEAANDCAQEARALREVGRNVSVEVSPPPHLVAGGTFQFSWKFNGHVSARTPVYLVLSIPGEVRFEIPPLPIRDAVAATAPQLPGFLALAPGTPGPGGLKFGERESRALVALNQPNAVRQSTLSVKVFEAGDLQVRVGVVARTSCGERELAETLVRSVSVAPGPAEIVVQDPFDVERPQSVIVSTGHRYRTNVFEHRYRVYDTATGARLVDRAGHDPNFSPTGRFIVAAVGDKGTTLYEVIDLVSREVVAQVSGSFVGWTYGDAYLIVGHGSWGGLVVRPTLVTRRQAPETALEPAGKDSGDRVQEDDQLDFRHPGSCHACAAWTDSDVNLDLDNGIVVFSGSFEPDKVLVYELASGAMVCCKSASQLGRFIAGNYAVAPFPMKRGWNARQPIRFSHIYDPFADPNAQHLADQTWFQGAKKFRDQLVRAETIKPDAAPVRLAGLSGTGVVRGDWRAHIPRGSGETASERRQDRVALELSRLGVNLAAAAPRETIPFVNSWAGADRRSLGFAASTADFDRIDEMIEQRTRPLEARLAGDVPAIARHLSRRNRSSDTYEPPLPLEGLDTGKIDLALTLEGLWRWDVGGRSVWLMQLWATEGNAGIGEGMILLLQGPRDISGAGRVTDMTKPLASFWAGAYGISDHQTQLKPQVFLDRYLVAASVAQKSIVVVDLNTEQVLTQFNDARQADLMEDVVLSSDGRHVIQFNSDGQFFIYEIETAQLSLAGRSVDDETIVYTPEGYYWASYEGAHFVQLRFPGLPALYPFRQFEAVLDRPDIIKQRLAAAGTPVPPAAIVPPPVLAIDRKSALAEDGSLNFRVDVSASGPLKSLRLYADGRLVKEIALSGRHASSEIHLEKLSNARWLTVQATDERGFVSVPQAVRMRSTGATPTTLHGLLVGVDRYSDPQLRLRFAESDSQRLGKALRHSVGTYYAQGDISVLVGPKAGKDSILGALGRLVENSREQDTLVFAFAGHGLQGDDGRYYLTPADFSGDRIPETGLAWAEIAELLRRAKGRVVVILDACHAGLSGSEKLGTNDDAAGALLGARNAPILVLAASKGRQVSYENQKWGGGLFTYALVEALDHNREGNDLDHDGAIEASELYRAVKGVMLELSGGQQTPWLARKDLIGDFALF